MSDRKTNPERLIDMIRVGNMPEAWKNGCLAERGKVLTGEKSHWCTDWDYMTVDETTKEFEACLCYKD